MTAKVMIVDDEPGTRDLIEFKMRNMIKDQNFEFHFCPDGQAALDRYNNGLKDVDVIVSDINMPLMNGFSLIKNVIKKDSKAKFIIMSAYGDLPNIRKAMNMGAYDFVTKPINFNDLEITIKRAITEAKERQRIKELEKKANDNLVLALRKEKNLNELRNRFISMVSHEYRSPMTVIQTSADLLKLSNDNLDSLSNKYIGNIEKQVEVMTSLMDDILTYSSLEDYIDTFYPMKININGVMRSIISDYNKNNRKNLDYEFINNSDSDEIFCDENLFNQIMRNLISNAEKYSNSGSIVRLSIRGADGEIECMVSDDGIGIPDADKLLIFEPFYRASNARFLPGTGLGLTIVRKCVEALKGTIDVETAIGGGATFRIKINCKKKFNE